MTRRISLHFLAILSPLLAMRMSAAPSGTDSDATVVIYNTKAPEAKGLADFYCSARGIDPSHEIPLVAPLSEEISRGDYDLNIAAPLRGEMIRRGYWVMNRDAGNHPFVAESKIRYAVLIRGIPLKIKQCDNYPGDSVHQSPPFGSMNEASVDSELSVLGLYSAQISGVMGNPLCKKQPFGHDLKQVPPELLMVSRLDAPTATSVRAMITNGIAAEKNGLWGWAYIDLRSTTDPGFIVGDLWIKMAGTEMRKSGITVLCDDLPETFPPGFPVTDAAAYFGWYSQNIDGPWKDEEFRFLPGAVAAHLHSFSATTLHDANQGWTGPLLEHGASASFGNVYEPYLVFTTDFGIFETELLKGRNLAESYYSAQPVLSWMSVLVGDPLYRPYAAFHDPKIKDSNIWSDYRRIVLGHDGNVLKAAIELGDRAREKKQSLYLEALGAAQEAEGVFPAAEASFRDAAELEKDPRIQFRLLFEQARVFEKWGRAERGAFLLRAGLKQFPDQEQLSLLLSWIQRLDPIKPPATTPTPPGSTH
jgi:uncharacterized protein (TIGR03790 family)